MKNIHLLFQSLLTLVLLGILGCQQPLPPTISTNSVIMSEPDIYTCGGIVTDDGGDPISSRGVCWSLNPNPTISNSKTVDGSGMGSFSSIISGLSLYTTYYVRAYATNSSGTSYGNSVVFKSGVVFDIDGNEYRTIKIGNQIWMADNLRTTRYRNGVIIPNISNDQSWKNSTNGAWCNFNNNSSLDADYGKLYNFYAVCDTTNKLSIQGWHIPSTAEIATLINYLGGLSVAGGKMKETGTGFWLHPNTGATNSSGFNGRGGGFRNWDGVFSSHKFNGVWWSGYITHPNSTCELYYRLNSETAEIVTTADYLSFGFSVRCIKD